MRVHLHWLPSVGFVAANPESGNVVCVPAVKGGWWQRTVYDGTLAALRPTSEVSEAVLVAFSAVTGMPAVIGDDSEAPTLPVGRALAEVQMLAGLLAAEAGRATDDLARATRSVEVAS